MTRFAALCLLLLSPCLAGDVVVVNLTPALKEYCHIVVFPSGWRMPAAVTNGKLALIPRYDYGSGDYEFRIRGLLGTKFLVRGVVELIGRYHTDNVYEVDLADPGAVAMPASVEEWNAATAIEPFPWRRIPDGQDHFKESGHRREGFALSPDGTVVVGASWSGRFWPPGGYDVADGCYSRLLSRSQCKFYYDVFNFRTGRKMITMTGHFSGILPDEGLSKSHWIIERYFIFPLSERRERCMVCEFGIAR